MNDETLLRCPFCGSPGEIVHNAHYQWWQAGCAECGCTISEVACYSADDAAKKWNTRAQASAPEGEPVAWKITFGAQVEIDDNRYEPISKTFVTDSKEIAYAHISSDDSLVVPLFTLSNAKAGEVCAVALDRMCQAFYENKGSMKWDKLLDCWKDNYRSNMRAALSTKRGDASEMGVGS